VAESLGTICCTKSAEFPGQKIYSFGLNSTDSGAVHVFFALLKLSLTTAFISLNIEPLATRSAGPDCLPSVHEPRTVRRSRFEYWRGHTLLQLREASFCLSVQCVHCMLHSSCSQCFSSVIHENKIPIHPSFQPL
jgi:hypothetical protein